MRIGLAQTRFPQSLTEGIAIVKQMIGQASEKNCDIVCFPESILPGLRGVGYEVEAYDHEAMTAALDEVSAHVKEQQVAVILPMEWKDELGMHLVAFVISETGEIQGYQTKNQIDPDEDRFDYAPGKGRQIFVVKDVSFGIVICHEGWRYPETVRWAARNGASIVFHPQFTGTVANPDFYKGAMVGRSMENNIYFASINFALDDQGSSTTLVSPAGDRLSVLPDGREGLLVWDIDPAQAHGLLARRFHAELF